MLCVQVLPKVVDPDTAAVWVITFAEILTTLPIIVLSVTDNPKLEVNKFCFVFNAACTSVAITVLVADIELQYMIPFTDMSET
jgi:uncharacterized membrane protein